MDRRELPPTLKNYVFETIQSKGLDWTEFEWTTVTGPYAERYQVSQLNHPRTGFFFLFDVGSSGDYQLTAWPGGVNNDRSIAEVKELVEEWIDAIAPELQAPDFWRIAGEQHKIGTDPRPANTPFTRKEQQQIGEGLSRLEEFVYQSEPELVTEKRAAVGARFGYLRSAVKRLGRIDWMTLMVGQFFGMATEKIITVQTFQGLYNLAASLLGTAITASTSVASKLLGS